MTRYAKKTDTNQAEIVSQLRDIPGVTVVTNMDDILVGYKGRSYWFEIKSKKPAPSDLRKSQHKLLRIYTGHYRVVWTLWQILRDIGICQNSR